MYTFSQFAIKTGFKYFC